MIRFLFGVIVGILIFFFFVFFGGGKAVKKVGEGITDTGKRMEAYEEVIKKEKEDILELKKKIFKEEKAVPKKSQ
jgi:hypothetical protein